MKVVRLNKYTLEIDLKKTLYISVTIYTRKW